MPISFGTSTEVNGTSGPPITFAFTVTSGNLLILRVAVSGNAASPGTITATYGGTSMTMVPNTLYVNAAWICSAIFYLKNPPTGSNNFVVSWTGSATKYKLVGTQVFDGGTPINGATQNQTDGTLDLTVTTSPGSAVIDIVVRGTAANTVAAVSGQTVQWNTLTDSGLRCAGSYLMADASTEIMSWDLSTAASLSMSACSIPYLQSTRSGFFNFFN